MLGVLDSGSRVRGLHSYDDGRLQGLARANDRLGAAHAFFEREEEILAGELRPNDPVNAGAVGKLDFLFESREVHLAGIGVGGLNDGKYSPEWLRLVTRRRVQR